MHESKGQHTGKAPYPYIFFTHCSIFKNVVNSDHVQMHYCHVLLYMYMQYTHWFFIRKQAKSKLVIVAVISQISRWRVIGGLYCLNIHRAKECVRTERFTSRAFNSSKTIETRNGRYTATQQQQNITSQMILSSWGRAWASNALLNYYSYAKK